MEMTAKKDNATLDWKTARDTELKEIIFNDDECPIEYKWQALHEMRRRNGQNQPDALQNRRH